MIPIERIREYLSDYSGFDLSTDDKGLEDKWSEDERVVVTCHNPEAIPITLREVGDSYIVSADLWRERYSDIDEALDRTLWCSDKTIRRYLVPVWRRARIDYRFNLLRPVQM